MQRKFVTTHLLESDCAHGAQDKIPREIAARRQMNIHYPLQNEAQVWSGVWPILADGVGLTDGLAAPSFPTRNAAPNCGEGERESGLFMAMRPERMDGRKGSKGRMLQGSAKKWSPGLVNFVAAVASVWPCRQHSHNLEPTF